MGPYEQCAESLVERGYATVPIMPGSKAPGYYCAGLRIGLINWQERYLHGRQPNYMDHNLWGNGDSGIGVVGGKASHGMVGVDIDTDDIAIKTAIVKVLPATPVKKIGQKGETRFYYGPDITVSRSWNINGKRVCDLIADGRQTVLPPTIHPDTGFPYRWIGDSLDLYDPDELPFLSADTIGNIDAVLIPLGWKPDPSPSRPGNGGASFDADAGTPHRNLNNLALARLDCWVPKLGLYKCRPARGGYEAVAHWRESSSGRELKLRKRNLSIHPTGIKDFGDGRNGGNGFTYTPLDLVMAANDCDLDTAFKFLSDHTGWAGAQIFLVDAADVLGPASKPAIEEPAAEEIKAEEPKFVSVSAAPAITPVDLWGKLDPPPLPHGILPSIIEDFAREQGETMGADPTGLAVAALTVCAAAIPDRIQLHVKRHSYWTEATRLWVALVGDPSTMKTPILNEAARPLDRINNELWQTYNAAMAKWWALSKAAQRTTPQPKHTLVRINDVTIESAQEILRDSPNGVLYLRDELSGFFGAIDKNAGVRGAAVDRAFWLQAYNGGPYTYNRVARGSGYIPHLSVSVLGGIQPEAMRKVISDAVDDGLIQRLTPIVLQPAKDGRDEPMSDVTIEYEELVERLHCMQPPLMLNVLFSDVARELRQELEHKHRELIKAEIVNKKLAAHIGKYDGIFARLCLLWHCIESPGMEPLPEVSEDCARRVANFLGYFLLPHAVAFYTDVYGLADNHDRLANVADYILAHKITRLNNRVIQRGDGSMRGLTRREMEDVCHQLNALGWVTESSRRRVTDPAVWDVNPEVHRLFYEHAGQAAARRQRSREFFVSLKEKKS